MSTMQLTFIQEETHANVESKVKSLITTLPYKDPALSVSAYDNVQLYINAQITKAYLAGMKAAINAKG